MNNQQSQGTTNQPDKGLGEMRCSSATSALWPVNPEIDKGTGVPECTRLCHSFRRNSIDITYCEADASAVSEGCVCRPAVKKMANVLTMLNVRISEIGFNE